jgi:pimeloyl-ACP methyl ester carboxylesterase
MRPTPDRPSSKTPADASIHTATPTSKSLPSDLQGVTRLATDATVGLAHLVESVHARVAAGLQLVPASTPVDRTGGITGLVYKSVRGVTRLVGGSVEGLLSLLGPVLLPDASRADAAKSGQDHPAVRIERDAIVAALNGVLGDYLVATHNPLALAMSLRHRSAPLPNGTSLTRSSLTAALPHATPNILLMVHGLCMHDGQWLRDGPDRPHHHGEALARDGQFTPIDVRYNSGLHVSINGRELAQQLEQLVNQWPHPVERLVIVGHSMGGLVARSAWHQAKHAGMRWPDLLGDLVFLGTPHHGAPMERAGHWLDLVLGATPYAAPFARLGKVRSEGITDLRHGNLLDDDWVGRDRFARSVDRRVVLPLPDGVRCFAVAATLGKAAGTLKNQVMGDGLVLVDSALGRHAQAQRTLAFPAEHQWVAHGTNHFDLLASPAVYERLRAWLV